MKRLEQTSGQIQGYKSHNKMTLKITRKKTFLRCKIKGRKFEKTMQKKPIKKLRYQLETSDC